MQTQSFEKRSFISRGTSTTCQDYKGYNEEVKIKKILEKIHTKMLMVILDSMISGKIFFFFFGLLVFDMSYLYNNKRKGNDI